MKCIHAARVIISMPDEIDQVVIVNGKPVRFDFDDYFGPTVLGKRGEPLSRQPGEHHPFWKEFDKWLRQRKGMPSICRVCDGHGMVAGEALSKRSFVAKRCPGCGGDGKEKS